MPRELSEQEKLISALKKSSMTQWSERFDSLVSGWIKPGMDVIDLGCEVGHLTNHIKNNLSGIPEGVDTCLAAIKYAKNKYPGVCYTWVNSEIDYLFDLERLVDCICIKGLLRNMDDEYVVKVLTSASHVVKPDGLIVINLLGDSMRDTVKDSLENFNLVYETKYRTGGKSNHIFLVYKNKGGVEYPL